MAVPAADVPAAAGPARSSRAQIAGIAVPVSLEFVLMLVLNFVNQIVVGALGATAIAAVGFANSLTFIAILTLAALGASVSILVARARGAGRLSDIDRTVGLAVIVGGAISTALAIPVAMNAATLLHVTGASPTVAAVGAEYLSITALAVIPAVLCAVLSGVLRSLDRARLPMMATIASVIVNAALGFSLVFGVGPMPDLGVAGAAWATLISTCGKLALLVFLTFGTRFGRLVRARMPVRADLPLLRPLLVLAVPLGVTELVWSVGTFGYNVIAQQLGDGPLAAAQLVNTLEAVFMCGSMGLMSATTALVGRALGSGDADAAVAWARRLTRAGVYTASCFGLLFMASTVLLGVLFPDLSDDVRWAATVGILINGAFQIPKVRNMIVGAGLLPSGNDTKGVILGDFSAAFLLGLPLAIVLGLFTPLGIVGLFVARVVEEVGKMAIFSARARRLPWEALARTQRAVAAAA